jgi:branched-chain amino acid transport system substrate-binding protein
MRNSHRRSRFVAVFAIAVLVVAVAAGSSAGASTSSAKDPLGKPNKATGTPIKIGIITDGKSDAFDDTDRLAGMLVGVKYANNYLGGINGHVIQVDGCVTHETPSGGTQCGVQMVNDHVAAVVVNASGQGASVFTGMGDSGIPYFANSETTPSILTSTNGFSVTNTLGILTAGIPVAQEKGIKRIGVIAQDVPALTSALNGPISAFYQKQGITLDVTPAGQSTADLSPQIQQELANGGKMFMVLGELPQAFQAIKKAGFTGPVLVAAGIPKAQAKTVPGGVKGWRVVATVNTNPKAPDVQTYQAAMAKYSPKTVLTERTASAFSTAVAFQRALQGSTSAVDAASVRAAISAMPAAADLPLGGGITFQCGAKRVSLLAAVCTGELLIGTMKADGTPTNLKVVETGQYIKP